jgi:flagellar FliL protein
MATSARANPKVVPMAEGAPVPVEPKKSGKTLFVILGGLLVFLLLAGGGAWYMMSGGAQGSAAEAEEEPVAPPVFLAMEPFTVNLQPEIGEQYLQVVFTLQVADQTQIEQIKLYMPLVRSRILMLLASKKPSELNTEAGKIKLQEEIAAQVTLPFTPKSPPQQVAGVFFTSFVIQ